MDKEKVCKICSKCFSSGKALGGHMRSHCPKLSQLLPNPKPMPMPIQMQMINHDRPSPSSSSNLQSPPHSNRDEHWDDDDDDKEGTSSYPILSTKEVAWCLVMMSRDGRRKRKNENDLIRDSEEEEDDSATWKFKCKQCNRGFSSYQALGGHNASHRRMNNMHDNNGEGHHHKVFECSLCPRVFVSGQALGGHKKVHFSIINNNISLNNSDDPHGFARTSIDLNRPPCYGNYDYDDHQEDLTSF